MRRATDTCVRLVELVFDHALFLESVNRVEEKREDLRAIPRMLEDEETLSIRRHVVFRQLRSRGVQRRLE
jgi:hypothetical protein